MVLGNVTQILQKNRQAWHAYVPSTDPTMGMEYRMQTALFDIGQQLSLVTIQKHVHTTSADTHMRVSLYRFNLR